MPYAYQQGDNCYHRGDYYQGDYYRGDPGFFDSIWGGIKGAVGGFIKGGPLGAVVGAAKGTGIIRAPTMVNSLQGTALAPLPPSLPPIQGLPPIGQVGPTGIAAQYGLINVSTQRAGAGTGMVPVSTPAGTMMVPCQIKGTHLNKHAYWTKHGHVEAHSVCVRNRRMNPANGRALRRALRRVTAFGRIVKRLKKSIGRANSAVGNVHHARRKPRA